MKVLVTGSKGQLGYDVVQVLQTRKHETIGVDIEEMDVTSEESVCEVIQEVRPHAVIHCAAWTAVDDAEDEDKKAIVYSINVIGTTNIAKYCKKYNCKMMYISTDYVFNGDGTNFWKPDDSIEQPLNFYGQTKYQGELAIEHFLKKYYIVRIAWAFGRNGKNFIKTMLEVGKKNKKIKVVCDQIGSPTYTFDLANLLADMIETDKYGKYHATNEGVCSWYEFACEIFKQATAMGHFEYDNEHLIVEPVTSDQYFSKAKRPYNSRMSKEKLSLNGFKRLPVWQDAVNRYLHEIHF